MTKLFSATWKQINNHKLFYTAPAIWYGDGKDQNTQRKLRDNTAKFVTHYVSLPKDDHMKETVMKVSKMAAFKASCLWWEPTVCLLHAYNDLHNMVVDIVSSITLP